MCGLFLSAQNKVKTRKLQACADYNFKTTNGSYSFIYTIKAFRTGEEKQIKIIVQPELGFSDLKTSKTNTCHSIGAVLKDKRTGNEFSCPILNIEQNSLHPNYTVSVPKSFLRDNGVADLEIVVRSEWNLGAKPISEELKFDFNK